MLKMPCFSRINPSASGWARATSLAVRASAKPGMT
jgi:hypothetical protein